MKETIIEVNNVTKRYKDVYALYNVSVKVPKGLTLLVGPNGSGKTTLIKIIIGDLTPDKGNVTILNCKPTDTKCLMDRVHVVFEETILPPYIKVKDFIKGLSYLRNASNVDEVLSYFELEKHLEKKIGELSKGLKRRLSLASAFIGDPEIIVMDEPYTGLDIKAITLLNNYIMRIVKKGTSIMIASHILPKLSLDHIIVLRDGRLIYSGDPPSSRVKILVSINNERKLLSLDEFNKLIMDTCTKPIRVIDVMKEDIFELIHDLMFT